MEIIEIAPRSMEQLSELLSPERAQELQATAERAREVLAGRIVWNVNATATGGGVAEMLQSLLTSWLGAGMDARWLVLRGAVDFFTLTKRIHNVLHGEPGDGGPLGPAERTVFEEVLANNYLVIKDEIRSGDVVILHDPQTAGLVEPLQQAGARVIWRCHIGRDTSNDLTDSGWAFLRPYIESAHRFVFSREAYAPDWVPRERLAVIPPAIDAFSTKNQDIVAPDILTILTQTGLVTDGEQRGPFQFTTREGNPQFVRHHSGVLVNGTTPPASSDRVILQVSRWDRLKDMQGVMTGFAEHLTGAPDDVHLMLAGPDVTGVSDDPEGAAELESCLELWRTLPGPIQRKVHLAALPMDDTDENAIIVNALQRHAYAVVQKSLMEGFGLTVTEAMWKGRPVVASAVGGINDQITDEADGLLLRDPTDLDELARALRRLLDDADLAERIGAAGKEHVRDEFLGDRHLRQYVNLFADLIGDGRLDAAPDADTTPGRLPAEAP